MKLTYYAVPLSILIVILLAVAARIGLNRDIDRQLAQLPPILPVLAPSKQKAFDRGEQKLLNQQFSSVKREGEKVRFVPIRNFSFRDPDSFSRAFAVGETFHLRGHYFQADYRIAKVASSGVALDYRVDQAPGSEGEMLAFAGSFSLPWK